MSGCNHLNNLQRTTGTTQEATDERDLAQSVGLGARVVGVGSGRSGKFTRAELLLGASRLVFLLLFGFGGLVRVIVIATLDGLHRGQGFLLGLVVLFFLLIGILLVAEPFQSFCGSLVACQHVPEGTDDLGQTNLQARKRIFEGQALSRFTLGGQGQGDGGEERKNGDGEEAEAGHDGWCILDK